MAKEIDDDARLAQQLGIAPEQVMQARQAWNKNHIMRAVFSDSFDKQIEERRTKLEGISPEELKATQGQINAFRAGLAIITKQQP